MGIALRAQLRRSSHESSSLTVYSAKNDFNGSLRVPACFVIEIDQRRWRPVQKLDLRLRGVSPGGRIDRGGTRAQRAGYEQERARRQQSEPRDREHADDPNQRHIDSRDDSTRSGGAGAEEGDDNIVFIPNTVSNDGLDERLASAASLIADHRNQNYVIEDRAVGTEKFILGTDRRENC